MLQMGDLSIRPTTERAYHPAQAYRYRLTARCREHARGACHREPRDPWQYQRTIFPRATYIYILRRLPMSTQSRNKWGRRNFRQNGAALLSSVKNMYFYNTTTTSSF